MFRIKTEALLLRPLVAADAPRFHHLCNDVEIAHNTARITRPYSLADASAFVARRGGAAFGEEDEYVFAVCVGGDILACAGAQKRACDVCEIGYWVGADYRRRGIASLAARAVTQLAFEKLGAKTVTAGYFIDNPASGRVLQRIGFRPTGETKKMHSAGRGCAVETVRMVLAQDDFELSSKIVIEAGGA